MFDRRTFIAASAAVAGAIAAPRMAFAAERVDVIVIGGGLSGLNAARLLVEQGLTVAVLEADRQVGGRIETAATEVGPIDLGASQIGRSYARVLDLCRRYNLELVPEERDLLRFGMHYQGQWIENDAWAAHSLNRTVGEERAIPPFMLAPRLLGKYNPLTTPDQWLDPQFAKWDISLRQLLEQKGHSAQALEFAAMFPPGISADGTSLLRMWQEESRGALDRSFAPAGTAPVVKNQPYGANNRRGGQGELATTSNILGGCHNLPRAMAAKLGGAIRLNRHVTAIEMSSAGATVRCADGAQFAGRFVINTLPFTMLRQVAITAATRQPAARAAIDYMPYANTARLYLYGDAFWAEDGLAPSFASDGPLAMFWAIDNRGKPGPSRAMTVLTGPAAASIAKLEAADAERLLLGELARLRPASKGRMRVLAGKNWARDPLALGCGFSLAPGQVNGFARDMIAPWDVMHFAGEHTRRVDFGMEAAAESGERAALEILAL